MKYYDDLLLSEPVVNLQRLGIYEWTPWYADIQVQPPGLLQCGCDPLVKEWNLGGAVNLKWTKYKME